MEQNAKAAWKCMLSEDLARKADTRVKQAGFRSRSAYLTALVREDLKRPLEAEDRILQEVEKSSLRLYKSNRTNLQATLGTFAMLDEFVRYALTVLPPPPAEDGAAVRVRARQTYVKLRELAAKSFGGDSLTKLQEDLPDEE